jgi:hypothetical protein
VASTRWLSLCRVCNWLGKHRVTIVDHFEAKAPAFAPSSLWWRMLLLVQAFIKPVDICFKAHAEPLTVIFGQFVMLPNLVTDLKLLLEFMGLMSTEEVTTRSTDVQCVTRGHYSATRVSIGNFVADLGHFALIRRRTIPDIGKRELEDGIGLLLLSAIESIANEAAERDSINGVTSDKLPPVIPRDLAKIAPREFNEVVPQQSQRLNLTGSRGLCTEV